MRERAAALTGCRAFALRGCWVLVVTLVLRAPSGPAAREIATREPAARSGRSRSPPVPSGPSGALHNSGAWWLIGGWARRLKARPGPDAAHQHPGLVLRSGGAAACLRCVVAGCLWCRWCSGCLRVRPPARSPHASFARSGRSRSPPVPSGPSGALHTGGVVAPLPARADRLLLHG